MCRGLKSIGLLFSLVVVIGIVPISAAAQSPKLTSPAQPLRAWALSLDGTVLVVDAENRLYRLGVTDLAVEAMSDPLFAVVADDTIYLAGGIAHVFVASQASGRTVILDMLHLTPRAELNRAGPLAADWSGRLYMASEGGIWGYKPLDPPESLALIVPGPRMGLGPVPNGLWTSQNPARLFVRLHDMSASPPHQHEFYRAYDLRNMSEVGISTGELGKLTRPAIAQLGVFVATLYSMSPFYAGNKLLLFDSSAQSLAQWQPLDGLPAISQDGSAVYLLRQRGVWVLSGRDMSVATVSPIVKPPPADMLMSPYGERLYLFGNGWMQVVETANLQGADWPEVSPFPLAWLDESSNHRPYSEAPVFRVYPSPQSAQDGTVLVQVGGYGETYRSLDGGLSWGLVSALTFPHLQETPPLSLSPEFATDRTVVGRFVQSIMRSTDGGDTWAAWEPPVAFVSDRSGNREVYTMAQDGAEPRQVTFDPAADEAPAWSPAWSYIAFQSERSGNWDIFSTRSTCADGATEGDSACVARQLTDNPADDLLPAWAPDGRSIAFVSTRDGNPEIYVMNQDGSNQRRLTFDPAGDWRPVWMPDSRHILFTSDRAGNNDIYSLEVPAPDAAPATTELSLAAIAAGPSDDRDPAISGSGRLLFLSDRDGVMKAYSLDLHTSSSIPTVLTDGPEPEGHPTWIDDQGYAALLTLEQKGVTNIYRACYACGYVALTQGQSFDGHPAWGPVWWSPDISASRRWLEQHQ